MAKKGSTIVLGINRNILECKCKRYVNNKSATKCINRNILECKFTRNETVYELSLVLIETYWNVNSDSLIPCEETFTY